MVPGGTGPHRSRRSRTRGPRSVEFDEVCAFALFDPWPQHSVRPRDRSDALAQPPFPVLRDRRTRCVPAARSPALPRTTRVRRGNGGPTSAGQPQTPVQWQYGSKPATRAPNMAAPIRVRVIEGRYAATLRIRRVRLSQGSRPCSQCRGGITEGQSPFGPVILGVGEGPCIRRHGRASRTPSPISGDGRDSRAPGTAPSNGCRPTHRRTVREVRGGTRRVRHGVREPTAPYVGHDP